MQNRSIDAQAFKLRHGSHFFLFLLETRKKDSRSNRSFVSGRIRFLSREKLEIDWVYTLLFIYLFVPSFAVLYPGMPSIYRLSEIKATGKSTKVNWSWIFIFCDSLGLSHALRTDDI